MDNDKQHLAHYILNYPEVGACGKSYIQRVCQVGYNQAARIERLGIDTGVLERDKDIEFLHVKSI